MNGGNGMAAKNILKCVFPTGGVACAAWLLCGCVAFNVGTPAVYQHVEMREETVGTPSAVAAVLGRGQLEQTGNQVSVGMSAEVEETFPKTKWTETVTVKVQKRLALGLFPGAAEVYLMPDGALDSGMLRTDKGWKGGADACVLYSDCELDYGILQLIWLCGCGAPQVIGTINSLLVQPFAGWDCAHDYLDKDHLDTTGYFPGTDERCADPSGSPKIRALRAFSAEERQRMGVRTCLDRPDWRNHRRNFSGFTHAGLIGCHKHLAMFVEPAKAGPKTATGTVETKRRRADVEGPYVAELSIPALGWTRAVRVGKGATRAEFALPVAERRSVAEAVVRFRADGTGTASVVTKGALEKMAGGEYRFEVTLQGEAGAGAAVPAAVPKASDGAYEVLGITPSGNGRYEVRVRIADKSRTFDVGWAVEPDVKRMIREDYVARHPGTGIQYVRELLEWETEEDGAILVCRGWAFSARPVSDGWTYDDGSRRGMVRLRISEGMPAEEARRWARENIEALVKEQNVALEAGMAPPERAVYRSLGESLEGGVLTVEFGAVE